MAVLQGSESFHLTCSRICFSPPARGDTHTVSGAGSANPKMDKALILQTLFCAASYNRRKGFLPSQRGFSGDFLHPLTTLRVDGKKAQISPECPSAESSDLFWHDQMCFTLTAIVGIDPRFQFV